MIAIASKEKIQSKLLQWFKKNKRDLPWRKTKDPYAIWVSEIMLQQTQVDTVIPYYRKFLKSFPTIRHLAKTNLSKVLKLWEGLGYYSRARNLHRTSKIIVNRFQSEVPDTLRDLLNLPGIGRSTAGAILSIAFDNEAPILDGNVKRVLSRLFAVSGSPGERKTEQLLWKTSESLIPRGHSNLFNQALMDLGSMLCKPKDPQCLRCPLRYYCKGNASGKPERFPAKSNNKKKIPHIKAVAAVISRDRNVLLHRRPPKGLLGGLWEFPNWRIEGKRGLRWKLRNYIKKEIGLNVVVNKSIGTFHQTYSHFKLTLDVFNCEAIARNKNRKWVSIQKLHLLPMSRIHRKVADSILSNLNF
jgi:A/G-specific adenine glycosylase